MITIPELAAEFLGSYLAEHMGRRFSATDAAMIELVPSAARLALDCIGISDAPYHNVEHTMLVTLVGYDIMKGRRLVRRRPQAIAHTSFSAVYSTTSDLFAASSKAMAIAMWSTRPAIRLSYRGAHRTPR